MLFAPPLHVTAIISFSNALGPVAAALVMRRIRPAAGLFTSFYGIVGFLFCSTFLAPAITAAGGSLALGIGQPVDLEQLYSTWVNWWLCDSGGALYLAPGADLVARARARDRRSHSRGAALFGRA